MENLQITLDEWMLMKDRLKQELLGVKRSFVRIGFALRKIEENRFYEQDGYKSVAEFAKSEYGLEATTVSRFMAINREYSIDGYSEHLRPEYAELGRSQLEEMLKLPEPDRQMIRPETARADIRELKQFNKTEPEVGVADDIKKLIERFFYDNKAVLNEVFAEGETQVVNAKRFAEIVNPSGNRSYRKGLYFVLMYEDKISIKKFGENPREMSWQDFLFFTKVVFGSAAAGGKTWEKYFGEEEEDEPGNVGTEDTGASSKKAEPEPERSDGAATAEPEISEEPETEEMGQEGIGGNTAESDSEFSAGEETEELGQAESGEEDEGEPIIVEAVEQKRDEEPEPETEDEEKLSDSEIGEAGIVDISQIAPAQKPANADKQRAASESKPEVIRGEIVPEKTENVRLIDGNRLKKIFMMKGKDSFKLSTVINEIELAPEVK